MLRSPTAVAAACAALLAGSALAADVTPLAHVEVRGDGPTSIVLIPGFSCDWRIWEDFMSRNADEYTMYAVTLPGFGGSDAPPKADAPAADTDDPAAPEGAAPSKDAGHFPYLDNATAALAAMIQERKLDKPVIVGHSMGAVLVYRLGVEHADKVGKLIVVDGFPAIPLPMPVAAADRPQMVDQFVAPSFAAITDEQWQMQADSMVAGGTSEGACRDALRDMFQKTTKEVGAEYLLELIKTDLTGSMAVITSPLLAIASIAPQAMANEADVRDLWNEQLGPAPSETIVYFKNVKHFIMCEAPEAFDKAVDDFVAGRPVEDFTAAGAAPADVDMDDHAGHDHADGEHHDHDH